MSITVEVGLLSGKTAKVNIGEDEQVGTLKRRAQTALGVGRGRLVDPLGRLLDACEAIKDSNVQNGDTLMLHIGQVQACGAESAFAAVLGDGSVASWGRATRGGNSSAVQDQLENVQKLQCTQTAFAAVLDNGSVVTWGTAEAWW